MAAKKINPNDPSTKSRARERMELDWVEPEALMGGTRAMREAGKILLPQRAREPEQFYRARLRSSVLFEAYKDAVNAIVAKPFSKSVTIKGTLPPVLQPMLDDIDGDGTSLNAFLREVFRTAWIYGGAHVLVDYPPVQAVADQIVAGMEPQVTAESNLAVEIDQGLRPYFAHVHPRNLLGVSYRRSGGRVEILQARVREVLEQASGEFGEDEIERVRVLERDAWRVFSDAGRDGYKLTDSGPLSLGFVPLHTFFVEKVGPFEYKPPLSGLASLNVTHWQSSSLQRNSLDIARIPVLVLLGFSKLDDEGTGAEDAPKSATVSSNVFFESRDTNAKAFYCEHTGAALGAGEADLKRLREEMEVVSMQPWIQRSVDTATGVAANDSKSECAVQSSVRELERFVRGLFETAAAWAKVELPADFEVDIFDEFGIGPARAQDVASLIQMRAAKQISHETFLKEVKKRAVLSDDVDVELEIERTEEERQSMASIFGAGFPFGAGSGGDGDGDEDGRGGLNGSGAAAGERPPPSNRVEGASGSAV